MNWEDVPIGTLFVWTGEQGTDVYKYLRKVDINKGLFCGSVLDIQIKERSYEVWDLYLACFPDWEKE